MKISHLSNMKSLTKQQGSFQQGDTSLADVNDGKWYRDAAHQTDLKWRKSVDDSRVISRVPPFRSNEV